MKKLFSIFIVLTLAFMSTGCIKRDNMEDITIYTTNYPTEYITKRLYGDYSKVKSIYPGESFFHTGDWTCGSAELLCPA